MTNEEWHAKWNEGVESIEQQGVALERAMHSLDVMEQTLDEWEAHDKARQNKNWFRRILG